MGQISMTLYKEVKKLSESKYNILIVFIVDLSLIEKKKIIGKVPHGFIWYTKVNNSDIELILTEIRKAKVLNEYDDENIIYERNILEHLCHPFIDNLIFSFQDDKNLYRISEFFKGCNLRMVLFKRKKNYELASNNNKSPDKNESNAVHIALSEEEGKFFIASAILALEYLHANNIIHYDIRPENFILNLKGYPILTNFYLAKVYNPENKENCNGTPGYISPEVLLGNNHGFDADFFSLGIMAYEFMTGKRPYSGSSREELKKSYLSREVLCQQEAKEFGWSAEAADFIEKLCKRDNKKRLGHNEGAVELKEHPWLSTFNWKDLYLRKSVSPYIPDSNWENNYNFVYLNSNNNNEEAELEKKLSDIENEPDFQNRFDRYYFFNRFSGESNMTEEDKEYFGKKNINPHELLKKYS